MGLRVKRNMRERREGGRGGKKGKIRCFLYFLELVNRKEEYFTSFHLSDKEFTHVVSALLKIL
jgi:hypothetical protein